ncbi:MAG: hypothetical protein OXE76_09650 [Alphaproteobacteria bacterium]|nr:hypothetical protein [Alphaproteobacteria bacterium]
MVEQSKTAFQSFTAKSAEMPLTGQAKHADGRAICHGRIATEVDHVKIHRFQASEQMLQNALTPVSGMRISASQNPPGAGMRNKAEYPCTAKAGQTR